MSVSKLASFIAESPTLKLNEEAAKLREKGEAVVHLGPGEPKNKAPIRSVLDWHSIVFRIDRSCLTTIVYRSIFAV